MTKAPSEVRIKFVEAALVLQLELGLDEPSISAICQRAGFARATFYEHFRDREELISAAMDGMMGGFVEIVLSAEPPGDVRAIVQNFMMAMTTGHVAIHGTSAWTFRNTLDLCGKNVRFAEGYRTRLTDIHRQVEAHILLGQRAGRVRSDLRPADVAGLLVTLAYGALTLIEVGSGLDYAGIANAFVVTLESQAIAAPAWTASV